MNAFVSPLLFVTCRLIDCPNVPENVSRPFWFTCVVHSVTADPPGVIAIVTSVTGTGVLVGVSVGPVVGVFVGGDVGDAVAVFVAVAEGPVVGVLVAVPVAVATLVGEGVAVPV